MIPALASNTLVPAHPDTGSVNRPRSSTGTASPMAMPLASHTSWSSAPKPGAAWTMPVPSAVSTKSPASTRKASVRWAKKSNSGT